MSQLPALGFRRTIREDREHFIRLPALLNSFPLLPCRQNQRRVVAVPLVTKAEG
jgi:hypothetical protein